MRSHSRAGIMLVTLALFSQPALTPVAGKAETSEPPSTQAVAIVHTPTLTPQPSRIGLKPTPRPQVPVSTPVPKTAPKKAVPIVSVPVVSTRVPAAVLALEPLIAQYDWPVATAMAIASCESGGNPFAHSSTDDHGIFQIHHGLAVYGQQIYDPAFNIAIAYKYYYKPRGFQPWSTFNNRCYLKYL